MNTTTTHATINLDGPIPRFILRLDTEDFFGAEAIVPRLGIRLVRRNEVPSCGFVEVTATRADFEDYVDRILYALATIHSPRARRNRAAALSAANSITQHFAFIDMAAESAHATAHHRRVEPDEDPAAPLTREACIGAEPLLDEPNPED